MNHTAGTNNNHFTSTLLHKPYNEALDARFMSSQNPTDLLMERVERLLVRYEELQRTNELLTDQVEALTTERDQLKQRLGAARARVDALLERISDPAEPEGQKDTA